MNKQKEEKPDYMFFGLSLTFIITFIITLFLVFIGFIDIMEDFYIIISGFFMAGMIGFLVGKSMNFINHNTEGEKSDE